MNVLVLPFTALAGVGLVASAAVHVLAWAGVPIPREAMALHVGIFVVFIPAVLVSHWQARKYPPQRWDATFRGAPPWVGRGVRWLAGYAIVNFLAFLLILPKDGPSKSINEFRAFSGHWMIFYAAACGMLYSAMHASEVDERRRCLNGHRMPAGAKFCAECGSPGINGSADL